MPKANVYLKSGRTFEPVDPESLNVHDTLPPGTYAVGLSPKGFFLETVSDLHIQGKLYGDVDKKAQRILDTFRDRPNCTGVLLSGDKGCGKTMLSKRVSERAMSEGIVTLVVNTPFCGDAFNTFLTSIRQPAVVIFDEFEKVYESEQQNALLTIFDGTYSSKKLFILTCNEKHRVNSYMLNRPGRIFYALEYKGLDAEFVTEYCHDNLVNKANIQGVVNCSTVFYSFSFDMLKALVEEMNRYDETATQAMQVLNMKPESDFGIYDLTVVRNGSPVVCEGMDGETLHRSPLVTDEHRVYLYAYDEDDKERPADGILEKEVHVMRSSNLVKVDNAKGEFIFKTEKPDTVVVCKRRAPVSRAFDYDAL